VEVFSNGERVTKAHTDCRLYIYGFGSIAVDVYNSTSVMSATIPAIKGILVYCMPPKLKYPVLYSTLLVNGVVCIATEFYLVDVSLRINNGCLIIEAL
jgi:hypothetical protein